MIKIRRNSVTSFSANVQKRLKKMVNRAVYASHIHDFRLKGKHPLRLLGTPKDPWAGSLAAGSHILTGFFYCQGQWLKNPDHEKGEWQNGAIWRAKELSSKWQAHVHSFIWLRDLNRVVDRRAARSRAVTLTRHWLQDFDQRHDLAWTPAITGQRIINWMTHAPLILDTNDLVYRSKLLNCLARQARHLYHACEGSIRGLPRLQAICGLILAGLYVPYGESWLKKGRELLEQALTQEILTDGGMASRSPEDLYRALRSLLVVRASYKAMDQAGPEKLDIAIRRMIPMLKSLLHGDGRLALFNGTAEQSALHIAATLDFAADFKDEAILPERAKSGFRRLANGPMVVIMDAGPPADMEASQKSHAGTLSFEMSVGKQRIIVNSGCAGFLDSKDIYQLSRSTAAHSTVVLAHKNSSEIRKDGLIGHGPTLVSSAQTSVKGHGLIEASHDGYLNHFGLIHHRAIYVNDLGQDLRGEDVLERRMAGVTELEFDVRFHIHPDITLSRQAATDRLLLRLPNGEYWQFQCSGGLLSVAESRYFGSGVRRQNARQILVSGRIKNKKTVIKWSLRRIEQNN